MKVVKKVLAGLISILCILAIVFLIGRYGWVIRGFSACTGAGIESVEVTEEEVTIKGFYPGSFPEGFIGYVSDVKEGKLYVGYRFHPIFGIFETGQFEVKIPVHETITEVYTKTADHEYLVWPK